MTDTATKPRLKDKYDKEIIDALKKQFSSANSNEVPRLEKIVVNVGLGRQKEDKKAIETATNTLRKITGQQPMTTRAKKSIASFKLREGQTVGLKVTLRGDRMYEFADRLINLVLPRLRDFHGVSRKAFDAQGNYAIGLIDQSVFPELSFEETTPAHGMQVILVIANGQDKIRSLALLEALGLPFTKENN